MTRGAVHNESCTIAHAPPDFYSVRSSAASPRTKRDDQVYTGLYTYVFVSHVCGYPARTHTERERELLAVCGVVTSS